MKKQIEHCSYLLTAKSWWYRFINNSFLQVCWFYEDAIRFPHLHITKHSILSCKETIWWVVAIPSLKKTAIKCQ